MSRRRKDKAKAHPQPTPRPTLTWIVPGPAVPLEVQEAAIARECQRADLV